LLVVGCLEQELAGALYARGVDESGRLTLEALLESAASKKIIDATLVAEIDNLKIIRNACAHFRPPLHPTGHVKRGLRNGFTPAELSERDALRALATLASS
jgi:hypothetical protein